MVDDKTAVQEAPAIPAGTADELVGPLPSIREVEVSIVIPCLNEAETVGVCVEKAVRWIRTKGIRGEVIIADNGSTDGSRDIAIAKGARAVAIPNKGYGNALMGGIAEAQGRFVIMGDADDSYDFSALDGFLQKLRAGYELVQGCRLPEGGGKIMSNACLFFTAGGAIRCSVCWRRSGLQLRFMMSIAAYGVFQRRFTRDWKCSAPGWNLPWR